MDRWHPYSDGTKGKGNVELLNRANYDGATIGNNEGITLSHDDLNEMYKAASFPVIVANLYHEDGSRPYWAKPYHIYTTKKGTQIAVVGLTAFFSLFYELLHWKLTDPLEELNRQIKYLNDRVDVIILLSHLGIDHDEKISEMFPEIDVILGAHTHHIFHKGKMVHQTLLGAAGKFGHYIGHMTLTIDDQFKKVTEKKAQLYDTNKLPPIEGENELIQQLVDRGKSHLSNEIIELQSDWTKTKIANVLCDALREWCEADCAILNEGLILDKLYQGKVTKYELLKICPHPINPCIVTLTGSQLQKVILQSLDEKWINFQMMGFGFRGKLIGQFVHNQILFSNEDIYLQDVLLQPNEMYRLAIPDMFTFGNFFEDVFTTKSKKYFLPEFIRDLLEWKLKNLASI
ncbi:bifunctional metallophosphatase/5'-nucleotidase [Bacillus aquiflavi]|nr:bifunctional UDP-sugar hydrolase/5'-nucleotidase [Bacillus aquiflavi]